MVRRLPLALALLHFTAAVALIALAGCGGMSPFDMGLGVPSYDPQYARLAAAQGRPTGAWASGTCDLASVQSCAQACAARGIVDACNDVGVINETGMGGRLSALSEYRAACLRGSAGACFNQARIQNGRSFTQTMTEESGAVQQQVGQLTAAISAVASGQTANASGRIDGRGASGAWSATFDACASGEPQGFFGVDLASSTGGVVLRVVPDPIQGPRARLSRAGSAPVTLDPRTCAVLKANVNKSGTRVNTVVLLDGDVALDCALPGGVNIVAQAKFSQCQRSAAVDAAQAMASRPDPASMAFVAERYDMPTLPAALRGLRVQVTGRLSGATVDGESLEDGGRACGKASESMLRDLGMSVVDGPEADVTVEFVCTGHVTLEDTGSELRIFKPQSDGVSVTLRHDGRVVDTFPAGPPALRCVSPGTREERRTACIARAETMANARIAGLLGASRPLAELAARRPTP